MDREPVGHRPALVRRVVVLLVLVAACARPGDGEPHTLTILYPGDERILSLMWEMPAKDVRWHGGVPVTAHDIAFSIRLLSHPAILGHGAIDSLVVHDDSTLTVRTALPSVGTDWWTVYYPRHLLEHLDPGTFFQWRFWERPVGNGPFQYVRHEPKAMWEMEANPDYYRGRSRLERLLIKFGGGAPTVELRSGRVLTRELMPLIDRDLPITFFAPNVQHFATHRRVRGLSSPYRADPLTHAAYVWLEPRP